MLQTRPEAMSVERKPVAFGDLRGWIAALEAQGELSEINAEVDWNIELGTIMRLAQGPGTGKALLFNNIKDYNTPASRCRRIFGSALNNYRRIAMMLGLPPDTHPRELVRIGRTILTGSIAPKNVATGAVKENILKGADVDLYEFPTPYWNRLDGGRYLLTYGGCVTKDPETGIMNVGVYRGMVASRDLIGAIRGAPVELVKCETNDLYVPASAEIVIEGYLGLDPKTYAMEGPYAEFTGYLAGDRSPKPTIRVTAITHRNDPILRGTIEGAMPGSYSENAMCSSIMRAATAWNVLDRAGVPGVTDVWCPPVQAGINLLIRMKQSYRNQAKQAANAIWGSSAAHVRYKHITVVDDDIDIHDYAAVDWAIAYRVNAGENDVVIMPATFGMGIDPSTRKRDRNATLFGTGKWNRVLIDATMNLDYDPDPDYGGARFPPTVWPDKADIDKAYARWSELGLGKPKGTSE